MSHAALMQILAPRLETQGRAWLDRALHEPGRDIAEFYACYSSATRKLGAAALELVPAEASAVDGAGLGWLVGGSAPDEIGRVLLLERASDAEGDGAVALASECYRTGDSREKRAVLRALPLLSEPSRFTELAVAACRTSVQTVFEGICCDNPYPAAHFPEPSFNQMVLKALFTGVALARILGLDGRLGPDLARMASDYAAERRAAGRRVPADIGRVLGKGEPR